ncbi:MAG: CocE/NonD family hydrolase [Bacteroidota bacterium]
MIKKFTLFATFLLCLGTVFAQLNPQSLSIPMRDGANLAGDLYLPNNTDTFPVILIQLPYNKARYQIGGLPLGVGFDISASDYAFVVVDWRCFYASTSACTTNVNRGEDGYDVVEWVAQQNWCDGNVGTYGPSALGNVQFETAAEQPPSLKCAVPEVSSPTTVFETYYPGGALRLEYTEQLRTLFGNAGMDLIVQNPHDNIIWTLAGQGFRPQDIEVPMLQIAGWYDHNVRENFWVMDTLRQVSGTAVRDKHKMLIGPWVHGGTGFASVGTTVQGQLSYPLAENWNDSLAWDFFDFYLRGIQNGWENRPRYMYYQMGADTWESSVDWPPSNLLNRTFYFHADSTLSETAPASGALSFQYDPTDPSPTVGGKTLNDNLDQGPYDQRPLVESRPDALVFSTASLAQDLPIKGQIQAHIQLNSDRKDTDLAIRLTDVYPDGRSMLLESQILRLRYRDGFTTADTASMTPGTNYTIAITFDPLAITLPAGHSLRAIVTGSNYPRYNRNMNTGAEVHPGNNPDSLLNPLTATTTLQFGAQLSRLEIPVADPALQTPDPELASQNLLLFPNPSDGPLHLRSLPAGATIEIFDLTGRRQFQAHAQEGLTKLQPHLPAGLYLVQAHHPDGRIWKSKWMKRE